MVVAEVCPIWGNRRCKSSIAVDFESPIVPLSYVSLVLGSLLICCISLHERVKKFQLHKPGFLVSVSWLMLEKSQGTSIGLMTALSYTKASKLTFRKLKKHDSYRNRINTCPRCILLLKREPAEWQNGFKEHLK